MLVRAGIRGNNGLISIGRAPNIAAELSALREGYALYATKEASMPMDSDSSYVDDDFPKHRRPNPRPRTWRRRTASPR